MARRTKEEANETRKRLLDAAEQLFYMQGVASTSLAQIAAAAGCTRGAVYWHFKDKADLFNAMMDRLTLPFEEELEGMMATRSSLQALRDHALTTMARVQNDQSIQRALSIALLMVELIPEHIQIRERHLHAAQRHIQRIAQAVTETMTESTEQVIVSNELESTARQVSIGMHGLICGLMHQWLIAPSFDLTTVCQQSLDAYLHGCGLTVVAKK